MTPYTNKTPKHNAYKFLLMSVTALSLSACASVPTKDISKAPLSTSEMTLSKNAPTSISWPQEYWWSRYNDQQLQKLIYTALSTSPSIDAADARLEKALQYVRAVSANDDISGSANGSIFTQKQSYNYIMGSFAPRGFKDYGDISLGLKKEFDIWGKQKAQLNSAAFQFEALGADKEFAKVSLASAIIAEYAKLQNLYNQKDLVLALRGNAVEYASLISLRFKNGLETKGSVAQADSQISAINLQLNKIDENIALEKNAIASLVGSGPQIAAQITRPTIAPIFGYKVPENLNLDIIGHRADVVAARLNAEAAAQNVNVKHADYYPNISISGSVGIQAMQIKNLFDSGSLIGQFGPAVSLPLFSQKTLDSQYYSAQADYNLAVAQYNQKVLDALSEVDQVAVNFSALSTQTQSVIAQINNLNSAYDIAQKRLRGGVGTKMEVLNIKSQIINNQITLNNLKDANLNLEIALIKALGGGYSSKAG